MTFRPYDDKATFIVGESIYEFARPDRVYDSHRYCRCPHGCATKCPDDKDNEQLASYREGCKSLHQPTRFASAFRNHDLMEPNVLNEHQARSIQLLSSLIFFAFANHSLALPSSSMTASWKWAMSSAMSASGAKSNARW